MLPGFPSEAEPIGDDRLAVKHIAGNSIELIAEFSRDTSGRVVLLKHFAEGSFGSQKFESQIQKGGASLGAVALALNINPQPRRSLDLAQDGKLLAPQGHHTDRLVLPKQPEFKGPSVDVPCCFCPPVMLHDEQATFCRLKFRPGRQERALARPMNALGGNVSQMDQFRIVWRTQLETWSCQAQGGKGPVSSSHLLSLGNMRPDLKQFHPSGVKISHKTALIEDAGAQAWKGTVGMP